MTTIEARYLDGSSIKVSKVESVGDIMFYFAKINKQFASDVQVACPNTGTNLSNSPTQTPPPVVQVAVKPEAKRSIEDLLLTLRLHSKREDDATCVCAYAFLKREYKKTEVDRLGMPILSRILKDVLEEGACGNAKIEGNILRTLIGIGVNANYFLQEAAGNGNEGRVRMLLAEGVPVERTYNSGSKKSCDIPALSAAAWGGHAGVAGVLLAHSAEVNREAHVHEMPSIPVCDEPGNARSPLILACCNGHADVVRVLIDHTANVNQRSRYTWPLYEACSQGYIDVVRILLLRSADVDYSIPFLKKEVPIMWASKHGDAELAKLLVSHKAKVQFFDDDFNTPLMSALRVHADSSNNNLSGRLEVTKLLLAHNASVNIGDQETGEKALLTALRNGKMRGAVEVLLDHQADPNAGNVDGLYPLLLAAQNGDVSVVNLLLAHKADPSPHNFLDTLAADAAKTNNKAILALLERFNAKHLLKKAATETQDINHEAVPEKSEPRIASSDSFIVEEREVLDSSQRLHDKRKKKKRKRKEMPRETDEEYEEQRKADVDYLYNVAKNILEVRNEQRRRTGKGPIKLGESFLNRLAELTNDAVYDLASGSISKCNEN